MTDQFEDVRARLAAYADRGRGPSWTNCNPADVKVLLDRIEADAAVIARLHTLIAARERYNEKLEAALGEIIELESVDFDLASGIARRALEGGD